MRKNKALLGAFTLPSMRTIGVADPDGQQWRVRVAWVPRWHWLARRIGRWRRRWTNKDPDLPELTNAGDVFDIVVIVGIVLVWLLLLLLLLVLDLIIVLIPVALGVVARVALRRPWRVEAVRVDDDKQIVRQVVGWRAARRARDQLAESLRSGSIVRPPVRASRARAGAVVEDPRIDNRSADQVARTRLGLAKVSGPRRWRRRRGRPGRRSDR